MSMICPGQGETTPFMRNQIWPNFRNGFTCNITHINSWPALNGKIFLFIFSNCCSMSNAFPYLWDCKLFLIKLRRLIVTHRYLIVLPSNYPQSSGHFTWPHPTSAAERVALFLFIGLGILFQGVKMRITVIFWGKRWLVSSLTSICGMCQFKACLAFLYW